MTTILAIWFVVCAVAAVTSYGVTLHYFRHKFPGLDSESDVKFALWMAALSLAVPPVVVVPLYTSAGPHFGFQWRP